MHILFFLFRFYFFILGLIFYLFLASPFFLLAGIFYLLFWFPLKFIVAFVGAAWENDATVFYDHMSEWYYGLKEGWQDYWNNYYDLVNWLIKGSKG